jgi:hypothetical protein
MHNFEVFFSNWKYIVKKNPKVKYAFEDFTYQSTPYNNKQRTYMAMQL